MLVISKPNVMGGAPDAAHTRRGDLAVRPDQAASVVPKGYLSLGGIWGDVSKPTPYK